VYVKGGAERREDNTDKSEKTLLLISLEKAVLPGKNRNNREAKISQRRNLEFLSRGPDTRERGKGGPPENSGGESTY